MTIANSSSTKFWANYLRGYLNNVIISSAKRRKADDGSETEDEETDWSEDFFKRRKEKVADRDGKRVKYCAYHGNSPLTKVAIVTENLEDDEKRVKKLSKTKALTRLNIKSSP